MSGEALGATLLDQLPAEVRRPGYDRALLRPGMAHIGVGAFHRCHQAEFTDDLLERAFDRWGVIGINIRPPSLAETLGRQSGLYTRLLRQDDHVDSRVIGCMVAVTDSQNSPLPALNVLCSEDVDVATMTVTEKGYCHRPATGELDANNPDILHDLIYPGAPRSLPGLLARALEHRMLSHGRPITLLSCDNIQTNGRILETVVRAMADHRGARLSDWIAHNVAFPSAMVDRIVPATAEADIELVEQRFGYRDAAVVVGEPYRQWVIEHRFAGRFPRWDLAGAVFVDDVTPFEHLKMRVLNGAQTTLAYLGVLAGYDYSFQAVADPVLGRFVRRMLAEETLPTLTPIAGVSPERYVAESLERLHNTAIRHRTHQIATDGSQKIVQRLLNPIAERLRLGQDITLLSVPVAGWMAYLLSASTRFGKRWMADDPYAGRIATIAERIGRDPAALAAEILSIDTIFDRELAGREEFRMAVTGALAGLLGDDPVSHVRSICEATGSGSLNPGSQQA